MVVTPYGMNHGMLAKLRVHEQILTYTSACDLLVCSSALFIYSSIQLFTVGSREDSFIFKYSITRTIKSSYFIFKVGKKNSPKPKIWQNEAKKRKKIKQWIKNDLTIAQETTTWKWKKKSFRTKCQPHLVEAVCWFLLIGLTHLFLEIKLKTFY